MAAIDGGFTPHTDRGQRPLLQRTLVVPAKTGTQVPPDWIPACAGMTNKINNSNRNRGNPR